MLSAKTLPPPSGALVLTGVLIRVLLKKRKKRLTRKRAVREIDEIMRCLVDSPARVVRVVEPADAFLDGRIEAVATWAAVKQTWALDAIKPPRPSRTSRQESS